MASSNAVGRCLAILKHLPSDSPVTEETTAFYALGLRDLSDDALGRAVARATSTCTFRPQPAELIRLAGVGEQTAVLPVHDALERIQRLGCYNPHGWQYPRIDEVRRHISAAAAEAYGAVGSSRLFGENETSRAIAERDFAEVYQSAIRTDRRAALPAPDEVRLLPGASSVAELIGTSVRSR